jgi:hypothetical protein
MSGSPSRAIRVDRNGFIVTSFIFADSRLTRFSGARLPPGIAG